MAYQIRLAVEEAVVNVIDYAYPTRVEGFVEVCMMTDGQCLKVVISDAGVPFDPLAETEMRQTPAFEADKQWYAQNFDCGDTFSQLIPDLEIPGQSDVHQIRILDTDMDCKANKKIMHFYQR